MICAYKIKKLKQFNKEVEKEDKLNIVADLNRRRTVESSLRKFNREIKRSDKRKMRK